MLPHLPAPGVIVGKVDLYPVVNDPDADSVIPLSGELLDEPEYLLGDFVFNGETLATLQVA
jgi:hypothetical protein